MVFGYFTLLVALVISAVAAYYSIVGLTAIFSAAVIPIIIMGAALEVGKVTAAVWLKLNWARARWTYKLYLVPAVTFLMVLTSMGIFGFLSKAHSDQNLVSGDVLSKIAVYDEKIKIAKENIDANRRALKQLDEAVDQSMARSSTEAGADKAVAIRRGQARERTRLLQEITTEQKAIAKLNEERAPIAAEVRKVEAEVGPIKYVAALIYGDNPDANLLERAVRWVIILIVGVFDPLALVLILAAQQSIRWAQDEKKQKEEEKISEEEFRREIENDPEVSAFFERGREVARALDRGDPIPGAVEVNLQDEQGDVSAENIDDVSSNPPAPPADVVEHHPDTHPYLRQGFNYPKDMERVGPLVYKPEAVEESPQPPAVEEEPVTQVPPTVEPEPESEVEKPTPIKIVEASNPPPKPVVVIPEAQPPRQKKNIDVGLTADNDPGSKKEVKAHFGISFPDHPDKGELFLRVDYLPSRLFKFNGLVWIEVDKSMTDSYVYNEEYIKFLIAEIDQGKLDPDDLSPSERDQITEFLGKNESSGNTSGSNQ